MKYAVISDVHANLEALSAVLASVVHDGVDEILCLGDIVGYAASPNECVDLVRAAGARSIAGNHDRAAVGAKDTSEFGARGRLAIAWTRTELTEHSLRFLRGLPSTLLTEDGVFLVHGALHPDPNDDLHLSTPARVARSLSELATGRFGAKVCFFGHTHRPAVYSYRDGRVRPMEGPAHVLSSDAHYLINPGSVGESRDRDPRAAYALFDARERRLELRRVEYDVASAASRRRAHGLPDVPAAPVDVSWWRRVGSGIVRRVRRR